uniref:Uncharacterized protein n=1 Tax=Arundo donax TaxID=35708 RepID=A0A0A9AH99_ARUDO
MDDCKPIKTPMPTNRHLDADEKGLRRLEYEDTRKELRSRTCPRRNYEDRDYERSVITSPSGAAVR